MAGKGKSNFTEVTRAAQKGKATIGTSVPPPKSVRRAEEIIVLHLAPPPLATVTRPSNT